MRTQLWLMAIMVLLVAGTASAGPIRAGLGPISVGLGNGNANGNNNNDNNDNNDNKGNKGSVCTYIPSGCAANDCRCDDNDETCTSCRAFPCPSGNKQKAYPAVVCRPCCADKYGHTYCDDAPGEDDKKCVPSPSH